MKLNILCDINWESRIDRVTYAFSDAGYRTLFEDRDYGAGLSAIVVILMCRDTDLHFKRRVRFDRKTKTIYMDIMLDFNQMKPATDEIRLKVVADRLMDEIPAVLGKYSIPDFDESRFVSDLRGWIMENGWTC